jgi:hypothetical protein
VLPNSPVMREAMPTDSFPPSGEGSKSKGRGMSPMAIRVIGP